jgi:phosphatidylserine/phosphatidylglycerophosphate/cardiolipin synthase-like enzyme
MSPDPPYWRSAPAPRAAVLLDAADYFAAARQAMAKARRSIHLLNWAFESRTRLVPSTDETIGHFLKARADDGIDVRILVWKSALPIAATQDWFPLQDRRSFANSAVKFVLDDRHPFGACHHQKVLLVDGQVAFCGGTDIGIDRWDTARHLDADPGRRRPKGGFFDARHEVMAVVDGAPAATLAELFAERWRRATGELLRTEAPGGSDAWPDGVTPDFTSALVGVSRTEPAWNGLTEVRESESLTFASIAAARRSIYMENQYLTAPAVAEALAQRLTEADGPEVTLISTRRAPSWFDRMTMDRARGHFVERLRHADRYGRLRILYPYTAEGAAIIVHAKFAIIDDDFVRVGSSNINNRSAGFDTECDLSFRLTTEADRSAARALRQRFEAHWDGRLAPIEPKTLAPLAAFVAAHHVGDPVGPADSFRLGLRRRRLETDVAAAAAGSHASRDTRPGD